MSQRRRGHHPIVVWLELLAFGGYNKGEQSNSPGEAYEIQSQFTGK